MNYSKIYNPKTGKFVNVNSAIGQKTLKAYVQQIAGAKKKASACQGVGKSACKPPACKWAAGKKRQYCRNAKSERNVVSFKNPAFKADTTPAKKSPGRPKGSKNTEYVGLAAMGPRPGTKGAFGGARSAVDHEMDMEMEMEGGHKGPCAMGAKGRCAKAAKGDGKCMLNSKTGRCVKKAGKGVVGRAKGSKNTEYVGLAAMGPRPGTKGAFGGARSAVEMEGGYKW